MITSLPEALDYIRQHPGTVRSALPPAVAAFVPQLVREGLATPTTGLCLTQAGTDRLRGYAARNYTDPFTRHVPTLAEQTALMARDVG
jgi:hypothetical protein